MTVPILLVIAALFFLILEVFLVSFGMLSIIAVGCGVGGAILAFREGDVQGWTMVSILLAGGPFVVWGAFRLLPTLPFARGLYLKPPKATRKERSAAAKHLDELLDKVGESTSPLRPAGTAVFDGEPVQVVTTGGMLPPGTRIRVVNVTGNRVVVEEAK